VYAICQHILQKNIKLFSISFQMSSITDIVMFPHSSLDLNNTSSRYSSAGGSEMATTCPVCSNICVSSVDPLHPMIPINVTFSGSCSWTARRWNDWIGMRIRRTAWRNWASVKNGEYPDLHSSLPGSASTNIALSSVNWTHTLTQLITRVRSVFLPPELFDLWIFGWSGIAPLLPTAHFASTSVPYTGWGDPAELSLVNQNTRGLSGTLTADKHDKCCEYDVAQSPLEPATQAKRSCKHWRHVRVQGVNYPLSLNFGLLENCRIILPENFSLKCQIWC